MKTAPKVKNVPPPMTPLMHMKAATGTLGRCVDDLVNNQERPSSDLLRQFHLLVCKVAAMVEAMDDRSDEADECLELADKLEDAVKLWGESIDQTVEV